MTETTRTTKARGLRDTLAAHVDAGPIPGAVALVERGGRVEVAVVGSADLIGTTPITRESIFRVASLTKPITAAACMVLVDDGRIGLDDPVREWLPELAAPSVARTPSSEPDDVVPAARPITVADLLTFRAGYGMPSDFSLPVVRLLFERLVQGPPNPQAVMAPDAWMATLADIPMVRQPGEAWLYNTCSDILGVLIARVSGVSLPHFMAERLFEPLGMVDTGFDVPVERMDRFTEYGRADPAGGVASIDTARGQWSSPPAFASGAGGLVSTVDDLLAFARMLLAGGSAGGRRVLARESVRLTTTDHLTGSQRAASRLFMEGEGWGFGGSVDVTTAHPWNVPGRYGWVGGTGTAWHIVPATGTTAVLLTQLEMAGPTPPTVMRDFWTYAAGV